MIYKVNRTENSITEITPSKFGDLQIKERTHLQEWIAGNPEMFGEELLIIQKEFDGFSDTSERLDLLALDKDGNLVLIENKLDDSGRNVVWQALKYVSYCSTLTTEQIVGIFNKYLGRYSEAGHDKGRSVIMDFLGVESEENLLLNKDDQRIIFVANEFRKEVTSTVLWLLNHDIQIQCFRTVPYQFGNEILLQVEQIIPLPETEAYMIEIKEKEKEKIVKGGKQTETEALLRSFWTKFQEDLHKHDIHWLDTISVRPRWYTGFGRGPASFNFCFGRNEIRVELYFPNDPDKIYFDAAFKYREEVQNKLGKVEWQRLDDKKASRIKLESNLSEIRERNIYEEADHQFYIDWFRDNMIQFHSVLAPLWERAYQEIKRK